MSTTNNLTTSKFNKFLSIGAMAVGIFLTTGYFLSNQSSNNSSQSYIKTATDAILQVTKTKAPIFSDSISDKQKEYLERIGDFSLENGLKDNQISRKVSQIQFSNKEFFLSLASEAEGFRGRLYNDNIGYAIGNGWNVSMQSKQYNEKIASLISKDSDYISTLASLSQKQSTKQVSGKFTNITIEPQRAQQVTAFMGENFKNEGVLKNLEPYVKKHPNAQTLMKNGKTVSDVTTILFNKLEPNEQAALVYHSYKVGAKGVSNYKNLLNKVTDYMFKENKTIDDKKNVAENFTYKYKINGKTVEDTRATILVASMFVSSTAFGSIIEKSVAPKKDIAIISQITKTQLENLENIPDPKGDYEKSITESGQEISTQIIYDSSIGYERQRPSGGMYFKGI